ncbi:MAG: MFS transporter [Micromonosporaceae bacterium]
MGNGLLRRNRDSLLRRNRDSLLRRNRDFSLFWAGQSISVVGTQVTAVALPLVATLTLHSGPAGVSVVATASYLPNVLLPLFVGHWLERRRRRPVMIAADVLRAATLAVVPLAYLFGSLSVPLLAGVAFVVGAASVVFDVGSFAYLPSLVESEDLAAANRASQGSITVAQVGGPGLAGVLVQAVGAPTAIVVDAVSYLGSAVGISAARRPEPPPPDASAARPSILSGLRIVLGNPYLRALTAHAAGYNAAYQILMVNLVVYALAERGAAPGLYGLALTAGGVGAFLGAMMALRLVARSGYGHAFIVTVVFSAGVPLIIVTIPLAGPAFAVALGACLLISGLGVGSANVLSVTLRQLAVPRDSLARSNGAYRLLIYGVMPFGSVLGGVVGQALGPRAGVGIGTAGMALSAIPMVVGRIRALRDPADAQAPPAEQPRVLDQTR